MKWPAGLVLAAPLIYLDVRQRKREAFITEQDDRNSTAQRRRLRRAADSLSAAVHQQWADEERLRSLKDPVGNLEERRRLIMAVRQPRGERFVREPPGVRFVCSSSYWRRDPGVDRAGGACRGVIAVAATSPNISGLTRMNPVIRQPGAVGSHPGIPSARHRDQPDPTGRLVGRHTPRRTRTSHYARLEPDLAI